MGDLKNLKWIFQKTKSQSINFLIINIINIVYSALSIYLILVSKRVIDAAISGTIEDIKKYVIQLVVICLVEIGLNAINSAIDAVTRAKLEMGFKQDVLNTILKRNYEKISEFHTGELLTRTASDVNVIIDTLISLIPNILSMVARLVFAVILLFQISKEFVTVLLIGGVILFVCINMFKPYVKKIHKQMQESISNVHLLFKEIFENLIVIKIFRVENTISQKSIDLQNERYKLQMKRRSIAIASGTCLNLLFQTGYLYALIWSTYQLYLKNITVGGLTSIVQLISQIQSPIIGLSKSFQNMFVMFGSAERIIELENIETDEITKEISREKLYNEFNSIVVKDLNFSYNNKKIFDNINFRVNKGEIVGIYGESGIGKSTLLKLILGIIGKDNGEIYFELDGKENKQEINSDTRNMFAYVPQGKFILSGTIRENITFVNPSATEEDIEEALKVSDCKSFIDMLPEGLETKLGERGNNLSEGQVQRLALARAVVSQAPILILDEITSSLDSKTEEEVLKNIKNLKNRTCIIVTHRNSISKICDKEFLVENMMIRERVEENARI